MRKSSPVVSLVLFFNNIVEQKLPIVIAGELDKLISSPTQRQRGTIKCPAITIGWIEFGGRNDKFVNSRRKLTFRFRLTGQRSKSHDVR